MCNNVLTDVIALCWVYAYSLCPVQHVINKVSHFKVMPQWARRRLINQYIRPWCFLSFPCILCGLKEPKNKHTCSLCFLVSFLLPFVAFMFLSSLKEQESKEGKQKGNEEAQIKKLLVCLFLGFSSPQSHQVVRICLRHFRFDPKHGFHW